MYNHDHDHTQAHLVVPGQRVRGHHPAVHAQPLSDVELVIGALRVVLQMERNQRQAVVRRDDLKHARLLDALRARGG
jgi:hypothetical protein